MNPEFSFGDHFLIDNDIKGTWIRLDRRTHCEFARGWLTDDELAAIKHDNVTTYIVATSRLSKPAQED